MGSSIQLATMDQHQQVSGIRCPTAKENCTPNDEGFTGEETFRLACTPPLKQQRLQNAGTPG